MVYLPLASQHLDVKTIGRGGPLRRLFKPPKWTPLFACLSTDAGDCRTGVLSCFSISQDLSDKSQAPYDLHPATSRSGSKSELGQTRKSDCTIAMSAFPPFATRQRTSREVRFVPKPDSCGTSMRSSIRSPRRRARAAEARS